MTRGGGINPRGSIWTDKDDVIQRIPSLPDAEKEQQGKHIWDVCPTASLEQGKRELDRKDTARDRKRWVCHCHQSEGGHAEWHLDHGPMRRYPVDEPEWLV